MPGGGAQQEVGKKRASSGGVAEIDCTKSNKSMVKWQ
jgi:hypothetical protein